VRRVFLDHDTQASRAEARPTEGSFELEHVGHGFVVAFSVARLRRTDAEKDP
jgi:hypothetical protein